MSPQAGRQRPYKRSDARFTVELLAQIAAIVAAALMLLAFFGVESADRVLERSRSAPPATAAPNADQIHRVPVVGGLLEAEATSVLVTAGYRVRVDYAPTTDGADVGRVLGQAPASGSLSPSDTLVVIVVGSAAGR